MSRIVVICIVIGCMLVFFGYQEMRLSRVAKETPQTIKCADLAAKGPGDNAHITLTDYDFTNQFVYQSKSGGATWQKVYVPAIPQSGNLVELMKSHASPDIKVIVKSAKVHSEADLNALAKAGTFQGMVVNEIDSLGSDERKLLTESYPNIDFAKVWIVEHARHPSGSGKVFAFMGGGTTLAVAGVGLFLIGRKSK